MDIVNADPGVSTHCSRYWHYNKARYMSAYTLATSAPITRNSVNSTEVFILLFSNSRAMMLDAVVIAIIK
jgi:hypothetical protein